MMRMDMLNLGHKALIKRIEPGEVFFYFHRYIGFYSMFGRELNTSLQKARKPDLIRTA